MLFSVVLCVFSVCLSVTKKNRNLHGDHGGVTELHREYRLFRELLQIHIHILKSLKQIVFRSQEILISPE
jgi:hypothetical protein